MGIKLSPKLFILCFFLLVPLARSESYLSFLKRTQNKYQVRKGDTLSEILYNLGYKNIYGKGHGLDKLRWKSGLRKDKVNNVEPGQVIFLPQMTNKPTRNIASTPKTNITIKNKEKQKKIYGPWSLNYSYVPVTINSKQGNATTINFYQHKTSVNYDQQRGKIGLGGNFGLHYTSDLSLKVSAQSESKSIDNFGFDTNGYISYRYSKSLTLSSSATLIRYILLQNTNSNSLAFADIYLTRFSFAGNYSISDRFSTTLSVGGFFPWDYSSIQVKAGNTIYGGLNYFFDRYNVFYGYSSSAVITNISTNKSTAHVLGVGIKF